MTIQYLDAHGQPLADAIVAVTNAPGQIHDMGMMTDDNGNISFSPPEEGQYTFSVSSNGNTQQVSVYLSPGEGSKQVVVE